MAAEQPELELRNRNDVRSSSASSSFTSPPSSAISTSIPTPTITPTLTPTPPPTDDETIHRCFICLNDKPDDTSSTSSTSPSDWTSDWTTPCSCSLEGHQACLMDWIADLEAQGKEETEIACPMCKSKIQVVDGDENPGWWRRLELAPVILSRRLGRLASTLSPAVLIAFLGSGTFIASAMYGYEAITLFAGPKAAMRFLYKDKPQRRAFSWFSANREWRSPKGLETLNLGNFCLLPYIAPLIMLNRLLLIPRRGTIPLFVTVFGWGGLTNSAKAETLTWPPTIKQAIYLMPTVQTSYKILHRNLVSRLEKKWEKMAKRSSAVLEQWGEGGAGGGGGGAEDNNAAPQEQQQQPNDAEDAGNAENADPAVAAAAAERARNQVEEWMIDVDGTTVMNFLAGSLLLPRVWGGMGDLLRLLLPRRLVTRPRGASAPTGLLQERWGRSLVAGCLYVVVRDAIALYVKYRRTVDRPRRRVRNVSDSERRARK